ncbi:MAG: hypothetical protein B7Y25_07085 [Alphaproteobacteria bacterium 16-39-46]|nr:MAG: hypothetical protein B7Y25_07085 [Alphaproteobacteria bacterium 16-39-46]OZA41952.1 MAG: hypothetical protein B7X84_07145 [Alphaproteobacteria bacterium 17-39-52]HQS84645.1 rod shape-determining protein MreC [Alphaproteobacteria bacterium]HQS94457.1 rod shape-determining protein MreC [Alphaproteobacteria bacterium]
MSSSKKLGLLSRAPQRFLTRRLRKLTLSPAFRSKVHLGSLSFYGVVVFFLIISSGFFGLIPSFLKRETLLDITAPLFKGIHKPFEAVRALVGEVKDFIALSSHLKDVHQIEIEKEFWKAQALHLNRENASLRKEVHFGGQEDSIFATFPEIKKTTRIIARSGEFYKHNVIIEGGRNESFLKGDVAVTVKGLIGRLTEVGQRASRLLLLTDIDARIPVFLADSKHHAILMGDGTDFPLLTRLQEDMMKPSPQIGEIVYTSGVGGIFPPNIPIGIIANESDGVFRVHPFVDPESIEMVCVLPSYRPLLEDVSPGTKIQDGDSF